MNKQDAAHSAVSELEKELIGATGVVEDEKLEGRRVVKSDTLYRRQMDKAHQMFTIKQGVRMRHPKRTLNQFKAIVATTTHADKAWEKALIEETERQEIDRIYRTGSLDLMSNQLGINQVAENNFRKMKPKLGITTMIGA